MNFYAFPLFFESIKVVVLENQGGSIIDFPWPRSSCNRCSRPFQLKSNVFYGERDTEHYPTFPGKKLTKLPTNDFILFIEFLSAGRYETIEYFCNFRKISKFYLTKIIILAFRYLCAYSSWPKESKIYKNNCSSMYSLFTYISYYFVYCIIFVFSRRMFIRILEGRSMTDHRTINNP